MSFHKIIPFEDFKLFGYIFRPQNAIRHDDNEDKKKLCNNRHGIEASRLILIYIHFAICESYINEYCLNEFESYLIEF